MRTRILCLLSLAGAALVGLAWLAGCSGSRSEYAPTVPTRAARRLEQSAALAHGGTATVNGAAYDAMFFRDYGTNPFVDTDEYPLSTFAVDVDTGSYTVTRAYLDGGHLPPPESVRVVEFVNRFDYAYAPPTSGDAVAIHLALCPSRFARGKQLLRIGLKAREIDARHRRPASLVFVIDTSGSMAREDRLELVKKALRLLVDELREGDSVGIVAYGSEAYEVLEPTPAWRRSRIRKAIDKLTPRGSTNAEDGLRLGYRMAEQAMRDDALSRIVLCSDGVANVGRTGPEAILKTIREQVARGITLSAVGFGMGNYNDVLLERLGDTGNGHYAYVDRLAEARRLFVENLSGTLQVVARDVKVQVEFDPRVVRSYRLIGYENRDVADRDFRRDDVDGGEIGAGHAVTALYELKLWHGDEPDAPRRRGVRLGEVRVRYREAEGDLRREVARDISLRDASGTFDAAPMSLRLAACAAEFAEILRESHWARDASLEDVARLARRLERDWDHREDVSELARLVARAGQLRGESADDVAER